MSRANFNYEFKVTLEWIADCELTWTGRAPEEGHALDKARSVLAERHGEGYPVIPPDTVRIVLIG